MDEVFGRSSVNHLPRPGDVESTLKEDAYDAAAWDSSSTLRSFRNELEGWYLPKDVPAGIIPVGMHNVVHLWVAGGTITGTPPNPTVTDAGTMYPASSPNDPVFFLHHCNIDRLWAVWQRKHSTDTPYYLPNIPTAGTYALNEQMIFTHTPFSDPWTDPAATPSQVVSHFALNYFFEDSEMY